MGFDLTAGDVGAGVYGLRSFGNDVWHVPIAIAIVYVCHRVDCTDVSGLFLLTGFIDFAFGIRAISGFHHGFAVAISLALRLGNHLYTNDGRMNGKTCGVSLYWANGVNGI